MGDLSVGQIWTRSVMDSASASGAEGCEFESHRVRHNQTSIHLSIQDDSEIEHRFPEPGAERPNRARRAITLQPSCEFASHTVALESWENRGHQPFESL